MIEAVKRPQEALAAPLRAFIEWVVGASPARLQGQDAPPGASSAL